MCLHSVVDRTLSNCHDKYTNVSLDEFDNCDYVTRITDVSKNDLIVIQLNIRGISSKRIQLMNLIDTAVHNREPDLILLSETWLTPFSPAFSIPGYELHHLDRKNKKGGGVGILSSSKLRCTRIVKPKQLRREPWLTPGLKISIDRNKRLYAKMLRKEVNDTTYKKYNRELRKIIRNTRCNYYCDKCTEFKSQTKKLWELINEISGKKRDKSTLIEYLHIGDIREYGAKRISNTFAKYFSQVGKNFARKIPSSNTSISDYLRHLQSNKASIYLNPTDICEIKKIVAKLPSKRSSGYDNISIILLKDIVASIAEVLCVIFNKSLELGEFPSTMKLAEVVPLYKGKEHYLETNYRPISLLTTISKVLEKIVYQRIYSFLQNTGQLYENQYGFREAHSCEHAIGKVVNGIVKSFENKETSACVLLDLSKAFDTIEHTIMLEKLALYGIRGNALSWFKSYLSNRSLRVKCRTVSSTTIQTSREYCVEYGTPQGSCLGPLIFLIFVNDLHLHLHDAECVQFADDTTLLFKHKNIRYLQFCIESELN